MKNIPVIRIVKEKSVRYKTAAITGPEVAAGLVNKYIAENCSDDRENFIAICLNTKNRVLAIHLVSTGTLNSSPVTAREVFKAAILANSASILLAHNHPSGDATPSREDIDITKRIGEAGDLLGISVLDHIVLGDNGKHTSLQVSGAV